MRNKVLFLCLEVFSCTGGIQKVSRAMAKALQELNSESTVYALCDVMKDLNEDYLARKSFGGFNRNKVIFSISSFLKAFSCHTIMLAHINLLPVSYLIKLFSPSKRIVLIAHGIEVWRTMNRLQKYFLNKHVDIWAVSEFTKNQLIIKNQIKEDRILILNNCLDPFFEVPSTEKHHNLKTKNACKILPGKVVFTLARLSAQEHEKGYDLVIQCMPKLLESHPGLKYLIGGACGLQEKRRICNMINALNLQNCVSLIGYIPETALRSYYFQADVFAMPSKKEGFGLVLIEAAASGCEVIAGNQDGSTDALLNGKLGILVDPSSAKQIAEALLRALSTPCRQYAKARQQLALSTFSFESYKRKIKELLT
jgi:phosphatidylinositol alpha-1,6-mannosyltransferase